MKAAAARPLQASSSKQTSPSKLSEALELLRGAGDDLFARAIGVVEEHRSLSFAAEIIERNRQRIGLVRPPRVMTPQRLFCLPFEDLLELREPDGRDAGSERLGRSEMIRCWRLVAQRLGSDTLDRLRSALHGAAVDRGDAMSRMAQPWWEAFAEALDGVAETDSGKADTTGTALIAEACRAGALIERLKRLMPVRPTARLSPFAKRAIRDAIAAVADAKVIDPRVVIHVLAHRLANPSELYVLTDDIVFGAASKAGRALLQARERVVATGVAATSAYLGRILTRRPSPEAAELIDAAIDAVASLIDRGTERQDTRLVSRAIELRGEFETLMRRDLIPPACRSVAAIGNGADNPHAVEDAARTLAKARRPAAKLGLLPVLERAVEALLRDLHDAGDDGPPSPTLVRVWEILVGPERAYAMMMTGNGVPTPPAA